MSVLRCADGRPRFRSWRGAMNAAERGQVKLDAALVVIVEHCPLCFGFHARGVTLDVYREIYLALHHNRHTYTDPADAVFAIESSRTRGVSLERYPCPICGWYHIRRV